MIEVLYFDGCPNHEPVAARLPQLLERAGVAAEIEFRRVESDEDAQRMCFLGSPTVRVDGRDVEPGADERTDFGLKCRLYRSSAGLGGEPLDEWIVAALGVAGPAGASIADEHSVRADVLLGGRSAKTRRAEASYGARAIHRSVIQSFLAGMRRRPRISNAGRRRSVSLRTTRSPSWSSAISSGALPLAATSPLRTRSPACRPPIPSGSRSRAPRPSRCARSTRSGSHSSPADAPTSDRARQ